MISTETPPRDVQIPSASGLALRGWYWPRPDPRGVLVVAHGFGEHGGCYGHVVEVLGPALGIDILSVDQRGHGRSPGRRGMVREFDELVADVAAGLEWIRSQRPSLPCFLLGHSNGGLLALLLMLDCAGPRTFRCEPPSGLIVTNPALKVITPVPPAKLMLGRLLLQYAPWVTLGGQLDATMMTSDPAMQREHEIDVLRHNRIGPTLFFGMEAAGRHVVESAGAINVPILMLLGAADPVIDCATSRLCFERLGSADKTLKIYPDMLHEPLNERGREHVLADIETWLNARISP